MSNTTNPNDEAFPYAAVDSAEGTYVAEGLTKREYFAALAMQGLSANSNLGLDNAMYAFLAVERADALIRQLNATVDIQFEEIPFENEKR